MLCLLALRDEGTREFLRQQKWREVLAQTPGTELLVRILESELRPDDSASLNAFMATLSPAEEGLVSSWVLQKVPGNATVVAEPASGSGIPHETAGIEHWRGGQFTETNS